VLLTARGCGGPSCHEQTHKEKNVKPKMKDCSWNLWARQCFYLESHWLPTRPPVAPLFLNPCFLIPPSAHQPVFNSSPKGEATGVPKRAMAGHQPLQSRWILIMMLFRKVLKFLSLHLKMNKLDNPLALAICPLFFQQVHTHTHTHTPNHWAVNPFFPIVITITCQFDVKSKRHLPLTL
jgi:hypothetical protein